MVRGKCLSSHVHERELPGPGQHATRQVPRHTLESGLSAWRFVADTGLTRPAQTPPGALRPRSVVGPASTRAVLPEREPLQFGFARPDRLTTVRRLCEPLSLGSVGEKNRRATATPIRWNIPATEMNCWAIQAEVAELTQALGVAAVELRVWKKFADGRLGPYAELLPIQLGPCGCWRSAVEMAPPWARLDSTRPSGLGPVVAAAGVDSLISDIGLTGAGLPTAVRSLRSLVHQLHRLPRQ
jgi:hypothetical protein